MSKSQSDPVNNPDHYTSGPIEVIDYIQSRMTPEEFNGYLEGNVHKYMARFKLKGKRKQDLEKARWYLDKRIEQE